MTDEEKKELQELINLLYNGHISQYGKRKLEVYIKKQQKEIEELKAHQIIFTNDYKPIGSKGRKFISEDKIKAKIEEVKEEKEHYLEMNDEYNAQICDCIIEEYESLLEKE